MNEAPRQGESASRAPAALAKRHQVHFSSRSAEWATPDSLFEALDAEFGFTLDPCATTQNAKCRRFFTAQEDGLRQDWSGHVVFMNPPYGRAIGAWMRKAFESSHRGATIVCLVPARTDTAWWHEYAMRGEIRFLRGRLRFQHAKHAAPFPSAVVVFRNIRVASRRKVGTNGTGFTSASASAERSKGTRRPSARSARPSVLPSVYQAVATGRAAGATSCDSPDPAATRKSRTPVGNRRDPHIAETAHKLQASNRGHALAAWMGSSERKGTQIYKRSYPDGRLALGPIPQEIRESNIFVLRPNRALNNFVRFRKCLNTWKP
jgi:site-specific DNA-methyltransferase (adenine-specific)